MGAAVRRIGAMLATLIFGTAIASLVIGLLFGAGVSRSLSVGWYVVGCALLIAIGFLVIVLGAIADSRHALV